MEAPRRYSASPFYSFVTVTPIVRQPTFPDVVRILWRWWRGDRPTWKEQFAEARLVDRLASELPDEPEPAAPADAKATR